MTSTDDLAAELAALLDNNPGATYVPGPTFDRFINSDSTRTLARAASQVGKTFAGARKLVKIAKANPGFHIGVLLGDIHNLASSVGKAVHEVCDRNDIADGCHFIEGIGWKYRGRVGLRFRNGAYVTFKSGQGPAAALEGATYDAVWVDEVPKEANYYGMIRGLRDGGHLWWTTTPIGRPVEWMYRRIVGDTDSGAPPLEHWDQFVVELSTHECWWLTEDDVQERFDKTAPHERAQRLKGAWFGPARTRVFTNFDQECIVSEVDTETVWSLSIGMDHGLFAGKQVAVLLAFDGENLIVIDECANAKDGTTPAEDADAIIQMLKRRGAPYAAVGHWTGDTNRAMKSGAHKVSDLISRAIAKRLRMRNGPHIAPPNKKNGSVEYGERIIDIALNIGALKVHERCVRVIRAMYAYGGGSSDPSKDIIDALRYSAVPRLMEIDNPETSQLWLRN